VWEMKAGGPVVGAEPVEAIALAARGGDSRFAQIEQTVSAILRFPGERMASMNISYGAAAVDAYRVTGTKGDLLVSPAFLFGLGLKHELTIGGRTTQRSFPSIDQFGAELKYFSECILEDREPEPGGEEGLADVRVVLALEESLRSGRPQPLAPLSRPRHPTPDQARPLKPSKPLALVNAVAPGH